MNILAQKANLIAEIVDKSLNFHHKNYKGLKIKDPEFEGKYANVDKLKEYINIESEKAGINPYTIKRIIFSFTAKQPTMLK
jgi:hypothetical protein